MKLSIIIPVYKARRYLQRCIESILQQTYTDYELILVNDGSTDNGETEKTALSYGAKIRYIHKENGGVSVARNTAISASQGD